jgi:ABC-type uncharacterized transport system auxiliary subunit
MRRIQQVGLVFILVATMAACGAAHHVHYYVIDAGPMTAAPASPQVPVTILVARITSTHLYRDDRLVYGSGPVELGTYEYERWSESPVDMVQDLVLASLRSTNEFGSVARVGSNQRGNFILRGHLNSLYEVDKPSLEARFSLELELVDIKSGMTVWSQTYSHDEAVSGKSVVDVIEAMDKNVHGGIQELTSGIAQYFASHPVAAAASSGN